MFRHIEELKRRDGNRPDVQYHCKHSGTTIYGEDLRPVIPDVEAGDISLQLKIDILLGMFWRAVLFFPKEILLQDMITDKKLKRWGYTVGKSLLDLIKWILMMEGVLSPTYRERIDHLQRTRSQMKASALFSFGADILEACYNVKTKNTFDESPVALFVKVIESYVATPGYLSDCLRVPVEGDDMLFGGMRGIPTPDGSFRRRTYNLYLAASRLRPFRFKAWYRWVTQKKYLG